MKNQWMSFFKGYVRIKVSGKLIEQFINNCVRENIRIWEVKRHGEHTVSGFVYLDDIKRLRKLVKHFECSFSFVDRVGFPFFIRRVFKNSGFVLGIVACLALILLLSNMVWNISITGANPKLEHDIEKELESMGITQGKFQFFLPTLDEIQNQLTEKLDMISWVGVDLVGTTYKLQVVEKSKPDEAEYVSPRHLVAKKKGIIYDYFIEKGKPLVEVNDYVNKGDILVSGIIGKEGKPQIVAAEGKVYAEIWYKSKVAVPLETKFNVYTGNVKVKRYLQIGSVTIPYWGFGTHGFTSIKVEERGAPLHFLKWELPIKVKKEIIRETEQVVRQYDQTEAKTRALELASEKLKEQLPKGSTIKDVKILHEKVDNGKVRIMIHFTAIENIASEQSIIQGD